MFPAGAPEVFLPTVNVDGEFLFDVDVARGVTCLFDPEIAIGYDHLIDSGPNFASVAVPTALPGGDDLFDLFLPGVVDPISLVAATLFDLTTVDPRGFSSFRIAGIDPVEALDPNDPLAFATARGFVDSGRAAVRMVAITATATVAEPPAGLLFVLVVTLLGARREMVRPDASPCVSDRTS